MTSIRVPYRQKPPRLPIHALETVAALLPRLRCGVCRGHLLIEAPTYFPGVLYCPDCRREYAEIVNVVPVRYRPLSRPKRGRPPKATAKATPRPPSTTPLCTDCQRRRAKQHRPRCQPCSAKRGRGGNRTYVRLIETLRSTTAGAPVLAAILGISPGAVRHLVSHARSNGVPIVRIDTGYRIEEVAS